MNTQLDIPQLQAKVKTGASNFNWIAVAAIINSISIAFHTGFTFPTGLGLSSFVSLLGRDFIDIAPKEGSNLAAVLSVGAFVITAVFAGSFALLGIPARNGRRWAFIVGVVLYALDMLVLVGLQIWVGSYWIDLLFHAWMLFSLFNGLRAANQLPETKEAPKPKGIKELMSDS